MSGKLHVIGVGPGDPELLTIKAARTLKQCAVVFTPKARIKDNSVALQIAKPYIGEETRIEELVFPMTSNNDTLEKAWEDSGKRVVSELRKGNDVAFLTLGDPMLYSTAVYLTRSVERLCPTAGIEIIPGIPAYGAAAALTRFSVGEKKHPVSIMPAGDNLEDIRIRIREGGTIAIMKVGGHLGEILDLLEETDTLDTSVFVSRAGMPDERIETDLRKLRGAERTAGYLSIILVQAGETGE